MIRSLDYYNILKSLVKHGTLVFNTSRTRAWFSHTQDSWAIGILLAFNNFFLVRCFVVVDLADFAAELVCAATARFCADSTTFIAADLSRFTEVISATDNFRGDKGWLWHWYRFIIFGNALAIPADIDWARGTNKAGSLGTFPVLRAFQYRHWRGQLW